MAGTISTNDPRGLGYQTGYFSGIVGSPVDQAFFNAAFSGLINTNKIYKDVYNCNIIGETESNMMTWMDEFGGVEYDCHPAYTNLEYNGFRRQIRSNTGVTVPAYPGTVNIVLSAKDHFVSGQYVLPQVGNVIALTPSAKLANITAVTHATNFDTVITVQLRSRTSGSVAIAAGDEMLILEGMELTDCLCPTGQFKFRDLPLEIDLAMIDIAVKGSLCGDAIEKCQFLKIPFLDADGKEIGEKGIWYTSAQQDMYRDLERRKLYEKLLNPTFGLIPNIRARGIKFSPTLTTAITTDDLRDLKKQLDIQGISGREYSVFAGGNIFSQFQRMLLTAGVTQLLYSERPMADCGWINMEYCGIKVEGLTLHIYEERNFSNGKTLGAVGMNYPDSAVFIPMWDNPTEPQRSVPATNRNGNGYQNKMVKTVYFQSVQGKRYDMVTDSNGFLNGPNGRNTFGTGCKTHEWSAEVRFLQEFHCMNAYIYIGLN
ncbi:MAG: hypothetical protein ABIP51_22700 [Bacteroidia bacterium]